MDFLRVLADSAQQFTASVGLGSCLGVKHERVEGSSSDDETVRVDESVLAIKRDFVQKVYGILGAQLAATAGVAAAACFVPGVGPACVAAVSGVLPKLGWAAGTVVVLVGLVRHKDAYPANLTLLGVFTFLEAIPVSALCFEVYSAGGGLAILGTAAVTAGVVGVMTLYVRYGRGGATLSGTFLFVGLNSLVGMGLVAHLLQWSFLVWCYHALGVMLFAQFIAYDTHKIVNGRRLEDIDMGAAISGSLELYLDILNIFVHLLRLSSGERKR
jgi:FtsH-binding integral membrane protein